MRSSVDGPVSPLGREGTGNNNNNNNNNNNTTTNENSGNSGSQYALCALGVGLVALGIVMIVWSVVPADAASNNSSSSSGGGGNTSGRKHKASSVAFVLVGSGVVMLLLSLCLGMRNKQREQQRLQEAHNRGGAAAREQEERQTAEEQAHRYAVPSYEEAVGSGQYPVRQSNLRPSTSQLPSYDDLVQVDGVQYESEGSEVTTTGSQTAPAPTAPSAVASTSNRRPVKNGRKLLPIKIRRIKSEKMHMKNIDNSLPATGFSIEPLTPPPQYEDKMPPL
ncbi:transmembrane protein 51a [Cyclopterus lumpus]|uniref:Transmembrane protein 51 n=1 Tax=Cyclopterus lumpus TaxID=8103 RepID=A0A8C2X8B7_CYCLU|nr:transmembrane protein 51a [Cyclopterus lumpus]XP_034393340.1 transmembrane protein 51a [Cyclopterus lumpus]XP_034393341.1 transmembrane protein 51a [Cyclopterus lumpus]